MRVLKHLCILFPHVCFRLLVCERCVVHCCVVPLEHEGRDETRLRVNDGDVLACCADFPPPGFAHHVSSEAQCGELDILNSVVLRPVGRTALRRAVLQYALLDRPVSRPDSVLRVLRSPIRDAVGVYFVAERFVHNYTHRRIVRLFPRGRQRMPSFFSEVSTSSSLLMSTSISSLLSVADKHNKECPEIDMALGAWKDVVCLAVVDLMPRDCMHDETDHKIRKKSYLDDDLQR